MPGQIIVVIVPEIGDGLIVFFQIIVGIAEIIVEVSQVVRSVSFERLTHPQTFFKQQQGAVIKPQPIVDRAEIDIGIQEGMCVAQLLIQTDALLVDLFCFRGLLHILGIDGGQVGQDLSLMFDITVPAGGFECLEVVVDGPGIISFVLVVITEKPERHGPGFRPVIRVVNMADVLSIVADGIGIGFRELHGVIINIANGNRVRLTINGKGRG
jgi:hypothetical protein